MYTMVINQSINQSRYFRECPYKREENESMIRNIHKKTTRKHLRLHSEDKPAVLRFGLSTISTLDMLSILL